MKGGKGKLKVGHRGGMGQDRGKRRDRVWMEADTSAWWRSGRNAGARADGTVGGKTTMKYEGMTRAGRGQDKLEGRVEDEIEGR